MKSQLFIEYDMHIFKLCDLNFSTCYNVCSIHRIEVVLTTTRKLCFCRITGTLRFGFRV